MKRFAWLLPLTGVLLVSGCERPATSGPEKVKHDAKEAADSAKKAALAKKDEYQRKVQADLDKLDGQLEIMKGKIKVASADAKAELQKKYDALAEQRTATRQKFDVLKSAGADAWSEMQKGLDKALDELKDAYEKAKDHFQ